MKTLSTASRPSSGGAVMKTLSADEAAEFLGESRSMVERLCRAGRLKGAYKGGMGGKNAPWRIPESAINFYQSMQPRGGY